MEQSLSRRLYICVTGEKKMLEGRYKTKLRHKLERMFPGCVILKNDASYMQGIPDLIVLYRHQWAMLETKRTTKAERQTNQPYWVRYLNSMSFAAFIYPENEKEVLSELQRLFEN